MGETHRCDGNDEVSNDPNLKAFECAAAESISENTNAAGPQLPWVEKDKPNLREHLKNLVCSSSSDTHVSTIDYVGRPEQRPYH